MTSLQSQTTPFVGRRDELSQVAEALQRARLVTLVGVGGVGKTRLAQRAADDLSGVYDEATWTVELAEVLEPAILGAAVANALGLRTQPDDRQVAAVADYLGNRQALLVLDNCEHLRDACAELLVELLPVCPGLRVLATSRQPLGVTGEQVYPVPPLEESEAVTLFVERARATLPGFQLTDANAESVTQLCNALEGLPLALELAAARLRVLTPEAMVERLDDRYQLLSKGFAGTPDRQRSLEASVDWSYELCTSQERLLWARLAVFSGGFDLAAAEQVCADESLPSGELLDVLSSLIDKSLLVRDTEEEHPHYRMLETIRRYGQTRLAHSDEAEVLRARHRDYFLRLADQFHAAWVGPDQPRWMRLLRRNHANLRAVLEHASAHPETARDALRMTVALENYWLLTGLVSEPRHWIESALSQSPHPSRERVMALGMCAYFAGVHLEFESADAMLDKAWALLGDADDAVAHGYLHYSAGAVAQFRREMESAVACFDGALERFRSSGYLHGVPSTLFGLAFSLPGAGQAQRAAEVKAECLELTSSLGEQHIRSTILWTLGLDARDAGELGRAESVEREALALKEELGDELGIALTLEALASLAELRGDTVGSATMQGAASRRWQVIGASPTSASYLRRHRELQARTAEGDDAFSAAYRRGQSLSRHEAVRLGLGVASEPRPEPSPLTRREREVATLVGEGLTNQQIATRLAISVRTAQGHVENILRKLGFRSRSQVAAWVARGSMRP